MLAVTCFLCDFEQAAAEVKLFPLHLLKKDDNCMQYNKTEWEVQSLVPAHEW